MHLCKDSTNIHEDFSTKFHETFRKLDKAQEKYYTEITNEYVDYLIR